MALMQCSMRSNVLDSDVSVNVILPYDESSRESKRAPAVLYLLHGYSDDHSGWLRSSRIERHVDGMNLAVVMPTVHNYFYRNTAVGVRYQDFIACELPDLIQTFFHVSSRREDTFIAGLSMGGYGAFLTALLHPAQYAMAASLSGVLDIVELCNGYKDADENKTSVLYARAAFGKQGAQSGTDADLFYLASQLSKSGAIKPKLLQYCGTEDFLYDLNQNFKSYIETLDFDYSYAESPGAHTWDYWDSRIQDVLAEIKSMNQTVCF